MVKSRTAHTAECVVLLHGIMRSSRCMRRLEHKLKDAGYTVLNLDYPSVKHDLDTLTDFIADAINDQLVGFEAVHFVGFSMGGLLIRALLHRYDIRNLGRVVMIGTPNHGSEVADFCHRFWLYDVVYGPAGQQLITDQQQLELWHDSVDYELGIIAGDLSLMGGGWWFIVGDNDGLVSVESTKIDGMKDHIVVPCMHTVMPSNKQIMAQTLAFLREGSFSR